MVPLELSILTLSPFMHILSTKTTELLPVSWEQGTSKPSLRKTTVLLRVCILFIIIEEVVARISGHGINRHSSSFHPIIMDINLTILLLVITPAMLEGTDTTSHNNMLQHPRLFLPSLQLLMDSVLGELFTVKCLSRHSLILDFFSSWNRVQSYGYVSTLLY